MTKFLCFPLSAMLSSSLLVFLLINSGAVSVFCADTYSRNDFPFPPHFVFGSSSSAYQYEGAAFEDGRTPSVWDTFAHAGNVHGDIACDGYHKYKEDVKLMVETGLEAYRFSISWSRLIPNGRGPVNPKGLEYYNSLINELVKHGIQPHVTLLHMDAPQVLEDEYGGWVSRKMVKDFTTYANVCFREFGDRVLYGSTVNEANIFVLGAYDMGFLPPQRCSAPFGVSNCSIGNSSTEPYVAAHHILLAHASAARLYKEKYQGRQHGFIGINLFGYWLVPYTSATEDVIATRRAIDFLLGWFVEPLVFGDYPDIVKKNAGKRLPAFTKIESEQVKGSFDFIGLNHYTTFSVKDKSSSLQMDNRDYIADMALELNGKQDGTSLELSNEFPVLPSGLVGLLEYFKQFYGNPPIYIHENGQLTGRNATLIDTPRVKYLHGYVGGLLDAVRNGSNARGYFTWSFMDLFEYEGAAYEDGRTPSVWDTFAHAGNVHGDTGDIACDGYHKYKEDVKLMVETGLEAYRFSISWSRLIPNGRGPVNPKGLEYYNSLINELVKHGIQPHITLLHLDAPQALEDEYGGWVSQKMVKDFTTYADVCFREFGDRVLYWSTVNEANIFVLGAYDMGILPPQRCSTPFGVSNCSVGNSSTEPYVAAHHILLAHASATRLYKEKYQGRQHGFIGINLFGYGLVPFTNATEDVIAMQRANDFLLGWFVEPLVFGDYPDIVKKNAGKRHPAFTKIESEQVKGSFDFIRLNHYTTISIKDKSSSLQMDNRDYMADMAVELYGKQGGTLLERENELPVLPSGLVGVLEYFKQFYGNPPIYIHENGQLTGRNATLIDTPRVKYLHGYVGGLLDAIRNGSNARGYFTWSYMDLFEVFDGYEAGYGLYYVDRSDKDLKRYPKLSAHWYSNFLKGKSMSLDGAIDVEKMISSQSQSHFSQ